MHCVPVNLQRVHMDAPQSAAGDARRARRNSVFAYDPRSPSRSVYGYVLYGITLLLLGAFIIWAYVPDAWLHALHITYYPQKYWAIAIPAYLCIVWIFIFLVFHSLTLLATPDFESINAIRDEYSVPVRSPVHPEGIPPLGDMDISAINRHRYDDMSLTHDSKVSYRSLPVR